MRRDPDRITKYLRSIYTLVYLFHYVWFLTFFFSLSLVLQLPQEMIPDCYTSQTCVPQATRTVARSCPREDPRGRRRADRRTDRIYGSIKPSGNRACSSRKRKSMNWNDALNSSDTCLPRRENKWHRCWKCRPNRSRSGFRIAATRWKDRPRTKVWSWRLCNRRAAWLSRSSSGMENRAWQQPGACHRVLLLAVRRLPTLPGHTASTPSARVPQRTHRPVIVRCPLVLLSIKTVPDSDKPHTSRQSGHGDYGHPDLASGEMTHALFVLRETVPFCGRSS